LYVGCFTKGLSVFLFYQRVLLLLLLGACGGGGGSESLADENALSDSNSHPPDPDHEFIGPSTDSSQGTFRDANMYALLSRPALNSLA
jgi:hypothetical protein